MTSGASRGMPPPRPAAMSPSAWRAFADGFGGGLIAGFLYCSLVAYSDPDGLPLAWMRVLVLSTIFGGFEIWRVAQERTRRSIRMYALRILVVSLFALWAVGALFSPANSAHHETRIHLDRV